MLKEAFQVRMYEPNESELSVIGFLLNEMNVGREEF